MHLWQLKAFGLPPPAAQHLFIPELPASNLFD
jgi:hypothetical protein